MNLDLTMNGIKVSVEEAEITRLLMERLAGGRQPVIDRHAYGMPKLGDYWPGQGGIFTGIGKGRDGEPDQLVITAKTELDEADWDASCAAAIAYTADGHHDFTLPWRSEQALQFANIRHLFKEEAYWSREQRREGSDSAWCQYFYYGGQYYHHKSARLRGFAVRRVAIW